MNENGANEFELSIVLRMFATLFCMKVVAKKITENVEAAIEAAILVEDRALFPTLEQDKHP